VKTIDIAAIRRPFTRVGYGDRSHDEFRLFRRIDLLDDHLEEFSYITRHDHPQVLRSRDRPPGEIIVVSLRDTHMRVMTDDDGASVDLRLEYLAQGHRQVPSFRGVQNAMMQRREYCAKDIIRDFEFRQQRVDHLAHGSVLAR